MDQKSDFRLSCMLNRRQNLNESQTSDPFFNKMKKLAGIK